MPGAVTKLTCQVLHSPNKPYIIGFLGKTNIKKVCSGKLPGINGTEWLTKSLAIIVVGNGFKSRYLCNFIYGCMAMDM